MSFSHWHNLRDISAFNRSAKLPMLRRSKNDLNQVLFDEATLINDATVPPRLVISVTTGSNFSGLIVCRRCSRAHAKNKI